MIKYYKNLNNDECILITFEDGSSWSGLKSVYDALRKLDGANIPPDKDNNDYQSYLAWLVDGNTPEPADEPVVVPEPEFIEYQKPIKAPDFIVASPKPKDKPSEALVEAVKEARKGQGIPKSSMTILLNLVEYIDDLEKRVGMLEKKK